VLAEWIAGRPIDGVLLEGKTVLPGFLVTQTQERIEPYGLGVQIQEADIAHLYPPEEVKNAFEEVTRAQSSITTREYEARQEAARLVREAQTEKFRIEKETESYQTERLRLARAEAERFETRLAQYRRLRQQNPDFLAALWWTEMGKVLDRLRANGRVDLLDSHLGPDGLDITVMPQALKRK
jgi:membrane protease subunit HflK